MSSGIELIKQAISLSEYIARFSDSVKPSGSKDSFMALCPLHDNTETPAMSIKDMPTGGVWKCFAGCGGGTIIDFWLIQHELDPKDRSNLGKALEGLSKELQVTLPEWKPAETFSTQRIANALTAVADAACDYLFSDDGAAGMDYLLDRGITEDEIERFLIGMLPPSQSEALALVRSATDDTDALVEAKFLRRNERDNKLWLSMYGRILAPITNPRLYGDNNVVGFGARVIPNVPCHRHEEAKWINSPDSDFYHKQRVLYNLQDGITSKSDVAVTEGYFDALAVDRTDYTGVAVCGTALTEHHLRILEDAKSVTIIFDGDEAGEDALLRHIWALNKRNDLQCGIIEGEDDPFDAIVQNERKHPWIAQPLLTGATKIQWRRLQDKPESFDKWVAETLGTLSFSQHRDELINTAASLRSATASAYARTLSYAKIAQRSSQRRSESNVELDPRCVDIVRYMLRADSNILEAIYAPFDGRLDTLEEVIERFLPAGDRDKERALYLRVLNPKMKSTDGEIDDILASLLTLEKPAQPTRSVQSIITALQSEIRSMDDQSSSTLLYVARAARRLSKSVEKNLDSSIVAIFDAALALVRSA